MTDEEKQAQSKEYMRAWRAAKKAADPEYAARENARKRASAAAKRLEPEHKARANAYMRAWLAKRPGYHSKYGARRFTALSAQERMWNTARGRAGRKGIPFEITVEDIHIPARCPVFGLPLKQHKGCGRDTSPSLDRIDNSKGYVPGNIQVISHRANAIKRDATLEELEALVAHLRLLRDRGVGFVEKPKTL